MATMTPVTPQIAKPLLIGGTWHTTEATLASYSPATDELLGEVCTGGADEIDAAVQAAQAAFPAWRAAGETERKQMLRRLHAVIVERRESLAELISREVGKPYVEALSADVLVVLDTLMYYVKHGTAELAAERIKPSQRALIGHKIQVVYEPVGVVGIIGPWNLPLGIPFTQIIAALIVGNTVVFKPSEWSPLVGLAIAEACVAAGLPAGVINIVPGAGAAGAALTAHPGTRRIIFTGSVATGRSVAVECARRLCPCVLELGGIGAAIVRADADPELAARGIVWSRFVNSGQVCVATQRVFVNQQIAAPFTAAVIRETDRLRVRSQAAATTRGYDVGPLINTQAVERCEQQVADAVASGARIQTGGKRLIEHGDTYFAPTVLTDVAPTMAVMREETFGPILAIMPVANDAEAVEHANGLPLGLAMTVWTQNQDAGAALGRQLESGMVWINEGPVYYSDPVIPWGGVKDSGIGRTHGRWGLQALTDTKVIAQSPLTARMWWFPYSVKTQRFIEALAGLQHTRGWRSKVRALAEALLVR